MKFICIGLVLIFFLFFQVTPSFAQLAPTPDNPQAASSSANSSKSDASATILAIKNFVTSTDALLGGFIFYTPDIFGNSIALKDGTILPGVATYRDIFYTISIPVIAIAIAFFALRRLRDETPFAYKSLFTKLFFVAILFIITPTLLSYSIQANNLLVQKITADQKFSQFITDFLDNEQKQIENGANPQQFGLPDSQPTFLGGAFQSLWKFILQGALFLIALIFFIVGFLFIAFQFIIRFATLLFLSVLFPIAIPFALSEKTEGITNNYFKTWFMFLIHQPAFALGYMLASSFLSAILATNGASLGMLFFYSGFLFFLGGVNTLVSHIFGSSWTAVGANIGAGMLTAPFGKSVDEFKHGALSGNVRGIRSLAGREFGKRIGLLKPRNKSTEEKTQASQLSSNQESPRSDRYVPRQNLDELLKQSQSPVQKSISPQSLQIKTVQPPKGAVHIQAEGYSVVNKKTGLTTTYPTKADAQADGYNPKQLQQTIIDGNYFESHSPTKAKALIRKDNKLLQQQGVKGVLLKQKGAKTKKPFTRIYSQEPL